MTTRTVDVLVVGAGVAGTAVAESLAATTDARVLIVEAESTPGLHSSGRSVSVFDPLYGDAAVQALSSASRPVLEGGLGTDRSFLTPRDLVLVATPDQRQAVGLRYPEAAPGVDRLVEREVAALFPAIRPAVFEQGVRHRDGADLDVAGLHDGLVARARGSGVVIATNSAVRSVTPREGGGWAVDVGTQQLRADILVNAAGAWADAIAVMAGARALGVLPHRRTVGVAASREPGSAEWAMLVDMEMRWYLKPDVATFLCSPADATPVLPGDPRPDELELARALEAIDDATTLGIRSLTRTWAGLRTMTADERPIIGFDPVVPGFFWHAGFGGFGIQVAPAAGALAAALIAGRQPALDPEPYSPTRILTGLVT